mgnify:FL=1
MRLFITGLTLIFIALKLTGDIAWPWWVVLGPMWMPWAAFLGLCAVMAVFSSRFRENFSRRYRELRAQRKARQTLETFMNRKKDEFRA